MQIFRGFENEKSILEIVRQVKIACKMLRTELTMFAGVSSFRTSKAAMQIIFSSSSPYVHDAFEIAA
jgi:hypothetical protein